MTKARKPESARERTMSWIRSIAVALVLWFALRTVLVGAFHITSGSMENTMLIGDVLFVNKALYGAQLPLINKRLPGFRGPRRRDIVVFESVEEPGLMVVKRLVGVPGDSIEMRENFVFVNGEPLEEPYVERSDEAMDQADAKMRWQRRYLVGKKAEAYRPSSKNWGPIVVPPDSFLAMGDNRDASYDSRYWGFLGHDRIHGRAVIVYFSYDKGGILPLPILTAIRWRRLFRLLR